MMTEEEQREIESGMHSIPMTIILKLKKQLNILLILNLILVIGLAFMVVNTGLFDLADSFPSAAFADAVSMTAIDNAIIFFIFKL